MPNIFLHDKLSVIVYLYDIMSVIVLFVGQFVKSI